LPYPQVLCSLLASNASWSILHAGLAQRLLGMNNEWPIDNGYASPGKFKKFAEDHPREYESLFANLDKVLGILREGSKMGSFQIGFFRSEGEGVFRIGQTGVESAKESRLYIYPDQKNQIMYILGIGTKDHQSEDINGAKATANEIKKQTTGAQ